MKAVHRNLRAARNRVNTVADRKARQALAYPADQQCPLVNQTDLFDARMASYAKLNWVSEDIPLATAF